MAILTTPAHLDDHAFAELSRWMFVYVGSRPFDPIEAAAADRRRREETDRAGPDRRVDRKRVALTLVIVISGPTYLVDGAAYEVRRWEARFGIVSGG